MPVVVKRMGDGGSDYRIVEKSTGRIATNEAGKPLDGGGHASINRAKAQAAAINASLEQR